MRRWRRCGAGGDAALAAMRRWRRCGAGGDAALSHQEKNTPLAVRRTC
jgi:hypothetical protein